MTRSTKKRKNASAAPARTKRPRTGHTHRESDSETKTEADDTPLTRADIPKIVDAVLNNLSTDGASSRDDSHDNPHLGESRAS